MNFIPYSFLKWGTLFLLVLYFFIGMTQIGKDERDELYIFFNWNLFSTIPNEKTDYSIEIYRIGDALYDPPLQYKDMKNLFDTINSSPTEYMPRIRFLAHSVEQDNKTEIEKYRKEVESIFHEKIFSYGVLKVQIDPVLFWRTGEFSDKEVIAIFENI